MCIIVFKPANKQLSKETIMNCFFNNNDGAGLMAWDSEKNKLLIEKGFFDLEKFIETYEKYKDMQCALHFRISTCGAINEANCHPFRVADNLGFVHNGSIRIKRPLKDFSDTWHFNEELEIVKDYWGTPKFDEFLESVDEYLGFSKLLFMDNSGNYKIYNEKAGNWEDGIWYSNHSYKSYYGYSRYSSYNLYEQMYKDSLKYDKPSKYEDVYFYEHCSICGNEYLNEYEYWNEAIQGWTCSKCNTNSNDSWCDKLKCEICGECELDVSLHKEMNKWACYDCEKAYDQLGNEEKEFFLANECI